MRLSAISPDSGRPSQRHAQKSKIIDFVFCGKGCPYRMCSPDSGRRGRRPLQNNVKSLKIVGASALGRPFFTIIYGFFDNQNHICKKIGRVTVRFSFIQLLQIILKRVLAACCCVSIVRKYIGRVKRVSCTVSVNVTACKLDHGEIRICIYCRCRISCEDN